MIYILWLSEFGLKLQYYLMYIYDTLVNSVFETTDDLMLFVGHCDLYFMLQ